MKNIILILWVIFVSYNIGASQSGKLMSPNGTLNVGYGNFLHSLKDGDGHTIYPLFAEAEFDTWGVGMQWDLRFGKSLIAVGPDFSIDTRWVYYLRPLKFIDIGAYAQLNTSALVYDGHIFGTMGRAKVYYKRIGVFGAAYFPVYGQHRKPGYGVPSETNIIRLNSWESDSPILRGSELKYLVGIYFRLG